MKTVNKRGSKTFLFGAIAALAASLAVPHNLSAASLTLTQAGIDAGFGLSTFATLDPGYASCCNGPFGVAVVPTGNVLVFNAGNQTRYTFADMDGQTVNSAIASTTTNPTGALAYANAGGQAYGGTAEIGQFAAYDSTGSVTRVLTGV